MHEMPIVMNVVNTLDAMAESSQIPEISGVVMQIGELASVMPDYFRKFWPRAAEASAHLKNAVLEIEMIPGIARCRRCGTEFHIEQNNGTCPACRVWDWDTVSGREVMIKEVFVHENQEDMG